jgi:hypothetical protein
MNIEKELRKIYEDNGVLTPDVVLEAAQEPSHPLHSKFDWDDTVAAHRWRLSQASHLIRNVKVNVEMSASQTVHVRAFIAKKDLDMEEESVGEYLPVESVVASDTMRTAWFRQLEKEWRALRRRAGQSKEFAEMVLSDLRSESA